MIYTRTLPPIDPRLGKRVEPVKRPEPEWVPEANGFERNTRTGALRTKPVPVDIAWAMRRARDGNQ